MSLSPSASARKTPNIWALASWTYGIVLLVTLLSVVAYYYAAPKRGITQAVDEGRSVVVGSVWIPVYPGATVERSDSVKQGNVTESALNFETPDQVDRVMAFYQAALKKGVFRFETVTKNGNGGTIRTIVHQGKTNVAVTIRSDGGRSKGEVRTTDRDTGDKDTR